MYVGSFSAQSVGYYIPLNSSLIWIQVQEDIKLGKKTNFAYDMSMGIKLAYDQEVRETYLIYMTLQI